MTFKIRPNTQLFKDLTTVHQRGLQATQEARDWITKRFGENIEYYKAPEGIYGGISGIRLPIKPVGWKQVGLKSKSIFFPNSKQYRLLTEINNLPVIKPRELTSLIHYGSYKGIINGKIMWSEFPLFLFSNRFILVECSTVADYKYIPVPEMTEILRSQFLKLKQEEQRTPTAKKMAS